jgi:hypothetical protein
MPKYARVAIAIVGLAVIGIEEEVYIVVAATRGDTRVAHFDAIY